jgi:Tol biopolymer transport system component
MSSSGTRLDTWKEIALYLGRNERTVQRWEMERKLVVHRLPGMKRGGVYAFTDELDAWMAQVEDLEEDDAEASASSHNISSDLFAGSEKQDKTAAPEGVEVVAVVSAPALEKVQARRKFSFHWVIDAVLLAAVLLLAGVLIAHHVPGFYKGNRMLHVQQLTFRHGSVRAARFRPDGGNLVFEASWDDSPGESLYELLVDRPESSPLRSSNAQLLAVSSNSTLALLLNPQFPSPFLQFGTLAVQGLYENKPRILFPNVTWADWSPEGSVLYFSTVTSAGNAQINAYSLESHQLRRIYPAADVHDQWFSHVRVSPQGDRIAFEQHHGMELGGELVVLNLASGRTQLSRHYGCLSGLAWRPDGKEIWFTAAEKGLMRSIFAVDNSGRERPVYQVPSAMTLQDISKNGEVLVTRDFATSDVYVQKIKDENKETNLSLFDWSELGDISQDGKNVVFLEGGDAISKPGVYLRNIDGGPATSLGEAVAPVSLAPKGSNVLALSNEPCARVVLLSPDQEMQVQTRSNFCASRMIWVPDGKHMVFDAMEKGHQTRCYLQTIGGSDARPITPENMRCSLVSPDGKYVLAQRNDDYYKIAMDSAKVIGKIHFPVLSPPIRPIRWLSSDKIVADNGGMSEIFLVDLATEKITPVSVKMQDKLKSVFARKVSADMQEVAFSSFGLRSDLFLIHGLR